MSDAPAIELTGIAKYYGDFVAVEDLSLQVPRGVIYGLLGPNGAGKTTTLRMINDILAPDRGSIRFFGTIAPGPEAAQRIGYLPEERGLYPKMKVAELLGFFGELRGLSRRDALARAGEWLERLGVADWAQRRLQDLSKGMQQKVQFASALLHEPELLILDEPWSGLDPINADVLREVVREQRAAGRTVVFSTHLMEQAEQICDSVCIIARGRKVLEGKLAELKRAASGDRHLAVHSLREGESARLAELLAASEEVSAVAPGPGARGFAVELAPRGDPGALLAALVAAGVPLRRFELLEPSLHQIFVEQVGDAAGAEMAGRKAAGDE